MHWTKAEQRAVLALMCIGVGIWGGILFDRHVLTPQQSPTTLQEIITDVDDDDDVDVDGKESKKTKSEETFSFDPNTADSTQLLRLGLAPYQVRNIYKYRAAGGRFHRPEDFKKIYGMTPEIYERLAPVIHIDKKFQYYADMDSSKFKGQGSKFKESSSTSTSTSSSSSTNEHSLDARTSSSKFTDICQLDLNTVDSITLKRIPQIASYRAQQILRYRERLGGFSNISQLNEIENLPYGIQEWFVVTTGVYRKININTATFTEMARHPYLGNLRAQTIIHYRKVYGPIKSLTDLSLLDGFSESDRQRLEPYITY